MFERVFIVLEDILILNLVVDIFMVIVIFNNCYTDFQFCKFCIIILGMFNQRSLYIYFKFNISFKFEMFLVIGILDGGYSIYICNL